MKVANCVIITRGDVRAFGRDSGAEFAVFCCNFPQIAAKLHEVSNRLRHRGDKSWPNRTRKSVLAVHS